MELYIILMYYRHLKVKTMKGTKWARTPLSSATITKPKPKQNKGLIHIKPKHSVFLFHTISNKKQPNPNLGYDPTLFGPLTLKT